MRSALQLMVYQIVGDDVVQEALSETLRVEDVIHLLVGPVVDDPELAAAEYFVKPDAEQEACRLFGISHVPGDHRIGAVSLHA